jgi:hypothetical protein
VKSHIRNSQTKSLEQWRCSREASQANRSILVMPTTACMTQQPALHKAPANLLPLTWAAPQSFSQNLEVPRNFWTVSSTLELPISHFVPRSAAGVGC